MSPRQKKAPARLVTAFLDTNVFLHFQPFDQIPWTKELRTDQVALRVPPDVIGELNKHKDGHKTAHLKERAGKILRQVLGIRAYGGAVRSSRTALITHPGSRR